jgi:phasin
MENAMSDQLNEQTAKMREMAQTTLDKAKDAVSKYMVESQKMRAKVDSSVQASYSNAKEMNEKAVAFAEANVTAGFELAQRLLQAKDPQEMGAVYQGHLKEQMEKMNAQFRELGNLASKPAPVDLNK